ncbi:MAG TPA: hypothetical protein VLL25_11685 [Acidimicrobiales bacterium]|nr:hypothetical protein [Acidimicrobiales bacterium]
MTFNRDFWEGRKPLAASVTQLTADLALIDIGWQLWSCQRVDANQDALGGIVTEPLPDHADDDTGELHRRWKVRNPYLRPDHPRQIQIITDAELQIPEGVEPPDRGAVVRMIRRLGAYVAAGHGWPTRYEIGAITDMWRLLGILDR